MNNLELRCLNFYDEEDDCYNFTKDYITDLVLN